jgi:TctA family transporter
MDILNQDSAARGFATAGTPINLLWAFVGCAIGTAIGVLPGLGPAVTVAMLLPITAQVEPTASMIFFAGIYYGAMYGGSTTSILLNTPGETGTMVTALEGFKMAKSGRAGAALATSAIGSFVAGTIATVLVTLFAPIVANYAVQAGPARILHADAAGLHHRQRGARQEHAARHDGAVHRPGDRPGRHGPDHGPGALHGRRARVSWTASRWCWSRWACLRSASASTPRSTRAAAAPR